MKLVSLKSSKERSEKTTGRNLSHPSASSSVTKNNTVPSSSNKRRAEDNNFVETSQRKPVVKKAKISSALDSIRNLSNSFEETSSVENDDMIVDDYESPNDNTSNMAGLPSDFFDSSQPKSEEIIDKAKQENLNETQKPEAIPEGFFDDPKLDAKARKVEYKDPADEEWEKFQKALSTENQVSEAIILEEDEESRVDRALDEISEQRLYYIRADVLRDKQVALKNSNKKNDDKIHEEMKVDNESDTDSDDIDDMFDWRAKKA
ncbi:zinc finger protein 830-like isoform X2 [Xenia sp. Carnegie-2017]|uniref:zinc finger protein 830-like isoform X2 n=1 Tax=Xenia sp. Carnegie-2017 TaxID=2897299 RepID=UPI001F04F331|nr:zinc finger protein 830-like isoform X2 [Xenia sp. Carnegie-2017]